jgi:hypothetical protein
MMMIMMVPLRKKLCTNIVAVHHHSIAMKSSRRVSIPIRTVVTASDRTVHSFGATFHSPPQQSMFLRVLVVSPKVRHGNFMMIRHQHTVVYAVGEGWTGALGTGRIDQMVLGHNDDDNDPYDASYRRNTTPSTTGSEQQRASWWTIFSTKPSTTPVILYDTSSSLSSSSSEGKSNDTTSKRFVSCAVGWGHTALIIEESTMKNHNSNNHRTDAMDKNIPTGTSNNSEDGVKWVPTQQPTPTQTTPNSTTNTQLLLTGRPHEFASLLRLQRLPRTIRNWMTYHTYNTIRRANMLEQDYDDNTTNNTTPTSPNNNTPPPKYAISFNPIDIIGHTLTFLSKIFGNPKTDPDWGAARDQSYLIVPTSIPLPFDTTTTTSTTTTTATATTTTTTKNDSTNTTNGNLPLQSDPSLPPTIDPTMIVTHDVPVNVTCTAGVTAITTAQGYIYTFGLNGIGQCGIGDPSNNVWSPSRVTGLSREFSAAGYRATALPQSFPIQQTCLGLQRTLDFFLFLLLFISFLLLLKCHFLLFTLTVLYFL